MRPERIRPRRLGLVLTLALFLLSTRVEAYVPPSYGPKDLNTFVTRNPAHQRVVWVMFEPKEGVTYRVYRHAYGDGRTFVPLGNPLTFTAGSPPHQGTGGWNYDTVFGYLYFEDGPVTDYAEYYYLVWQSGDPVWSVPPVEEYVVARAFPPTQTRHGEFSEYTNACPACHGLHSSRSQLPGLGKLLRAPTQTDLCATCHDGSGSKYDEVLGRVRTGPTWDDYTKSPAGPFGSQFKATASVPVTAVHNVYRSDLSADGSPSATAAQLWQAPGSTYLSRPDPDPGTWTKALVCTGCHEPHNKYKNFRLLRGDFDLRDYNLPDNQGYRRVNVVVRGVSEVNLAGPPPPADWQSYTRGQAASRYLGGSDQSGGAITDFCSGCHRYFTGPYNELDPQNTGVDDAVYDNPGTHGWKRHRMGMPAYFALSTARIIDPGLTGDGIGAVQSWLRDWDGTNLQDYVPLEGTFVSDGNDENGNEYAQNRVVCLTCHVPHGTVSAAGGMGPTGELLQLEVAYWNKKLNATDPLTSDDPTAYQFDRNTGLHKGRSPISGYLHHRLKGPNGESLVIYGWSAVLARFQPLASACWRCHSTK